MPDQWGFDHLPTWGHTYHSCIECGWPGPGVLHGRFVSERERELHFRRHESGRRKAAEKQRQANLAKARKAKQMAARENKRAYGEEA